MEEFLLANPEYELKLRTLDREDRALVTSALQGLGVGNAEALAIESDRRRPSVPVRVSRPSIKELLAALAPPSGGFVRQTRVQTDPGSHGSPDADDPPRDSPNGDSDNEGACRSAQARLPGPLTSLSAATCINLGSHPELGELRASVPENFYPYSSNESYLRNYVPSWYEPAAEADVAIGKILDEWTFDAHPGLFWSGSQGYYWQAIRWALRTLAGFADLAVVASRFSSVCGFDAATLRSDLAVDGAWQMIRVKKADTCRPFWQGSLSVSADGTLSSYRDVDARVAFAVLWRIRLCRPAMLHAALADYLFWWGHRLWDYHNSASHLTADEARNYAMVAELCARAAVAEIAQIAALLLHEYGHIRGSKWHCNVLDSVSSGGTTSDPVASQECCQYLTEWVFVHALSAELALPPSRHPVMSSGWSTNTVPSSGQFSRDPWSATYTTNGGTRCDHHAFVSGDHCSLLFRKHRLDLEIQVGPDCVSGALVNEKLSLNVDDEHCGEVPSMGTQLITPERKDDDDSSGGGGGFDVGTRLIPTEISTTQFGAPMFTKRVQGAFDLLDSSDDAAAGRDLIGDLYDPPA